MKRFPKHHKEEIILRVQKGETPASIARDLRLNRISVYNFLHKQGIKTGKFPGVENEEEILSLYKQGYSNQEISNELSLNHNTVVSLLYRHGVRRNPILKNPTYFSNIDTPNKAYFLGFIAADGAIVGPPNKNPCLTISIHKKDKVLLEVLKKELKSSHKITSLRNKNYNQVRFTFVHPTITNDLISYGVTRRKSKTLQNVIDKVPEEFKPAFIIGYFDGDGSVTKSSLNSKTVSFRGTEEFLTGIRNYLGFGRISYAVTYVLTFTRFEYIKEFYSLYEKCDFFLMRKYEKFNECRTISSPYSSINRG